MKFISSLSSGMKNRFGFLFNLVNNRSVILITFCLVASIHYITAQSLSYSGGLCAGNSIDIFIIGGSNCGSPTVSSPSSWQVSPSPSTISYLNSNKTIRVTWNTAVNASVYVNYGCASGGSSGTTNPLNLTISNPVTPSVSLSTNNPTLCQGSGSIQLTATPTNGGSPNYTFYVDGSNVYSGSSNTYTYSTAGLSAGNHTTYVSMSSSLACASPSLVSSSTLNFNVAAKGTYSATLFAPSPVCTGTSTINPYVTVTGTYYNLSYEWFINGNSQGWGSNSITVSANQGTTVYCKVYSDGCVISPAQTSTYTINLTQSITPTVGIQVPKLNYCGNESITFTANSAYFSGSTTYTWKMNGVTQASSSTTLTLTTDPSSNTSDAYFGPGDVVTVTATNLTGTCLTTTTATGTTSGTPIVVSAIPSATISGSNTFCAGSSTILSAPAGMDLYQWYKDGVIISGATASTYSVSQAGSYTVWVSKSNCSNTSSGFSVTQTTKATYTAVLYGPSLICSNNPNPYFYVDVTGAIGTMTYHWFKGSGPGNGFEVTSTSVNNWTPSVTNGEQYYCMVTSNYWCVNSPVYTSTYTVSITTSVTPTVSIQIPKLTYCAGEQITFTANSPYINGGSQYVWKLNGVTQASTSISMSLTTSTSSNTSDTFFGPGDVVTVNVTNLSGTCLNSTSATGTLSYAGPPALTVYTVPTVAASNVSICSGTLTGIVLTNNVPSTLNTWTVSQSLATGASASSGTSGSVNPYTYTLNQSLSTTTAANGSVTYTITPSVNGCIGSPVNVVATVKPVPNAAATNQTICSGQSTSIAITNPNGVSGTTYSWSVFSSSNVTGATGGTGTPISQTLNSTSYSLNGSVVYRITPSANGCNGSTVDVTATTYPLISEGAVGSNQTICSGSTPTPLTNQTSASGGNGSYSYQWLSSPDGSSWSPISGATSNAFSPGILNSTTYYSRQVTSCGTTKQTTPGITITVDSQTNPGVLAQSVSAWNSANGTLTLGGVVVGAVQKWQSREQLGSWVDVTNLTTSQPYNINPSNDYQIDYRVVVKNGTCSAANSNEVSIIIAKGPVITSNKARLSMGDVATLDVGAGFSSHVWTRDGSPIGTDSPILTTNLPGVYSVTVAKNGIPGYASADPFSLDDQLSGLNENYIIENSIQVEGITNADAIDLLNVNERAQTIQYFDGLGRPVQTVSTQGSPNKKDIVQPVVYDDFGREAIKYLPYVSTASADGWIKSNPLVDQSSFYQGTDKVAMDTNAYSITHFEASPLNRVLEQGAPGAAWQPDNTDSYTSPVDRSIKKSYEFNTDNEVLLWTYTSPDATYPFGKVNAGTAAAPVYYTANQLYRNRTKDEQGHEMIEYVDKLGRTVLKSVQADASSFAHTYYIYNDLGNLVFVLSPKAVDQLINGN